MYIKANKNTTIFFFLYILIYTSIYAKTSVQAIKIISTSALLSYKLSARVQEYIHAFQVLKNYGYVPYIIEAVHPGPNTFLNNHSKYVTYPNLFDPNVKNKGVNEGRAILKGMDSFKFNAHDMIIKMTGRYYFNSNNFLCIVENNPKYDAFVKTDSYGQVFTGCFALRYQYFIDMLRRLDFASMEKHMINIEAEVALYLKKNNIKTYYLNFLDVTANMGMEQIIIW